MAKKKVWDPDFKVDNYLKLQIKAFKFLGLWPIQFENYLPGFLKPMAIVLKVAYGVIMAGNLLHLAICQVKTLYDNWGGHLDDISNYMQLSIIYVGGFCMTVYYQVLYHLNWEMVEFMNKNLCCRSRPGLTFVTIQKGFETSRKYSIYWMTLCTSGTFHYAIVPILMWKRVLPLICWYPIDTSPSPIFEFIFFWQVIGQIQIGLIYSAYSATWMSCLICLCCQFDILFCEIKNLLNIAMIKRGDYQCLQYLQKRQRDLAFEEPEVNEYYDSKELLEDLSKYKFETGSSTNGKSVTDTNIYKEFDEEINQILLGCILRHQIIIKTSALVDRFFSNFLFGKLFVTSFLICFFLYTSSVDGTNKLVNILEYLGLTAMELMLICYYPSMLSEQSTRMSNAIVRAPWTEFGTSVRKTLIVMMINSRTPIRFTAGKFFIMDFHLFMASMKASFSYYTVLKNLRIRAEH